MSNENIEDILEAFQLTGNFDKNLNPTSEERERILYSLESSILDINSDLQIKQSNSSAKKPYIEINQSSFVIQFPFLISVDKETLSELSRKEIGEIHHMIRREQKLYVANTDAIYCFNGPRLEHEWSAVTYKTPKQLASSGINLFYSTDDGIKVLNKDDGSEQKLNLSMYKPLQILGEEENKGGLYLIERINEKNVNLIKVSSNGSELWKKELKINPLAIEKDDNFIYVITKNSDYRLNFDGTNLHKEERTQKVA